MRTISWLITVLVGIGCAPATLAHENAGAKTSGGDVPGTRIILVQNLNDDGPGSLREAIAASGPRVIVFTVSGYINLARNLKINKPYASIAGQTAPAPGIILRGATFSISTHDVVVEHIGSYPGPSSSPEENEHRDSLALSGRGHRPDNETHDVILRNVSLGWSVDEIIETWYSTTRRITIESSILAEPLANAGHPKGRHSMTALIGSDTRSVLFAGNLLAHGNQRNPVLACNASAAVLNNLIYDPGRYGIHFYSCAAEDTGQTIANVQGNVIRAGPSTSVSFQPLRITDDMRAKPATLSLFISDNVYKPLDADSADLIDAGDFPLASSPSIQAEDWRIMPSATIEQTILASAGMMPSYRNPIDARVTNDVKAGTGKIIDSPMEVGGWTDFEDISSQPELPKNPEALTSNGMSRLAAWLCERHLAVGGPRNASCINERDFYKKLLEN